MSEGVSAEHRRAISSNQGGVFISAEECPVKMGEGPFEFTLFPL